MRMRNAPLKAFVMDGDKKKKDAPVDLTRKKTIPMVGSISDKEKKRISNEQDNKELDRHEDAMGY